LPADLVVDLRPETTATPSRLNDTALATCAAAVVATDLLPRALAWGAPVVTDAASARAAGAENERHLLVAPAAKAMAAAQSLGSDHASAAPLSRSGRRLAEEHDLDCVAETVVERLQLVDGSDWRRRLDSTMGFLGTRPLARLRIRVDHLIEPLEGT